MADEGLEVAVQNTASGVRLLLEVHPGSARSGVEGVNPWRGRIVVAVRAAPTGGRANDEVLDVLAAGLGVARGDMRLVTGRRGRQKAVEVVGLGAAEARGRLLRLASKG